MRAIVPFFLPVGTGDEPSPAPDGALGHDLGVWLAERNGRVVTVDPTGSYPELYVSESVSAFSRLTDVFGEWYASLDEHDVPDVDTMASLRADFDQIDPTALSNSSNWWPAVIEQVEAGLL